MQKSDARLHSAAAAGESKLHFLDYWRVIRVRFGIVLLTFLLVVISTAVVTYLLPKKYSAHTTLELKMPTDESSAFDANGERKAPGSDPRYLQTQFEIIQSSDVLYPVVDKQGLSQKWAVDGQPMSRENCFYKLRSMMNLKEVHGTELLEVSVKSTSPEEARDLVNAIADNYEEIKRATLSGHGTRTSEAMDKNIEHNRALMNEALTKLHQYRQQHPDLRDPDPENRTTSEDPYQAEINAKQSEVDKDAVTIAALTSQLQQIERLKGEELMRALSTLQINDPTVQQILPKYQDAVSQEALLLNSGLGPNHPKVKSLRASREVYTQQLTDQIASIKHSEQIQLDIQKKTADTVRQQLDDLMKTQVRSRADRTEYDAMKEDYLKKKSVLQEAELAASKQGYTNTMPIDAAQRWNKAEVPTAPSSPNVPLNMAIGVLAGLLAGISLAFFIEYLDTSVKTMDDVESMLGVPVLAIIPKNIKLLHKQPADVPDAEAYRILRTNIEFNRKSADANTISMVSGGPGEGKSTTLANLAYTCAQGGYSVLIVDADLRRPTQHKIFELNNSVGLTNYLTTNVALEDVILPSNVENLSIMPSGILPADAVGILNSQRMSDMIAELKTRYDIIFFDSPPILGVSDGAVLASEVDQSIIIVQHRRFPRAMLMRVKQAINNVGGTVLGVVLNNVDLRHDPNYAYYTSYYEYYAVRTPAKEPGSVAAQVSEPAGRSVPTAVANRNGADDHSEY